MMVQWLAHPFLAWATTWLFHSTLLLGAVWLFERLRPHSAPRLREHLWRVAIFVSLISASAVSSDFASYPTTRFEITQIDVPPGEIETEPKPARVAPTPPIADGWQPGSPAVTVNPDVVAEDGVGFGNAFRPSPVWVLFVWGAIAALLFIRLYHTFTRAVAHLGRRRPLDPNHRAHFLLDRLAARAGCSRPPKLTVSNTTSGPVSLPGNEICLPKWALTALREAQLEGVLAHELAHCLRRDPVILLVVDSLRRLMFAQPLMHVAARRLADLAELAADENAVELTGNQHAMAESLAECAGRLRPAEPAWGVAMAQNTSSFMYRIRRLLHPERFTSGGPAWHTRIATATLALLMSLALPAFVVAARDADTRSASAKILTDDDGSLRVIDLSISEQGYSMEVEGTGDFTLNDEETDVVDMAEDASLVLEEGNGKTRKIRYERDGDAVERSYWVDGKRAELDADANEWLAEALPRLMRESGVKAEQRVDRLLRQDGADRVLDEIELVNGSYTVRVYTARLVRKIDLDELQYDRLLDAVERIDGDYDSRTALSDIAEHEQLDDRRATRLLDAAKDIDSDYELRMFAEHLIANTDIERTATGLLIEVISSIDSDYEMRMAFATMLEDSEIPVDSLPDLILVSSHEIDSDYDLSVLLQSLVGRVKSHEDSALAYIGATMEIESDYDRREALTAFADQADSNTAGWTEAIMVTATIDSEHERAETLIRIARRMPATEEIVQLYRRVSETLGEHDRERALSALGMSGV